MVVAQSSSCHPSSTRSNVSFLCFPSCFGRGGGRNIITSYHHCRIWGLVSGYFDLLDQYSHHGENSVAASSSSFKMAKFISWISSRNVWIEVREFRVSSLLEISLHYSISASILEAILYIFSFTFRSPWGGPCVFHVSSRLSHVLVVSSTLSKKNTTPSSTGHAERSIGSVSCFV